MHCPGVHKDSVFVASADDEITGFAVLSITTEIGGLRQGNLLEFQAKNIPSVQVLIQATLNYCNDKDVDMIVVGSPALSHADEALKDWLKLDVGVMMVKTLSHSALLHALLSNDKIRDLCESRRIVFQIGKETVEVGGVENEYEEEAIEVTMSPQTFLRIILGQVNSYVAYLTKRVRIQGVWNILPVLKLMRMMRLPVFYISPADRV